LPKYLYPEKSVKRKERTQIVAELRRKGNFPFNASLAKLSGTGIGKATSLQADCLQCVPIRAFPGPIGGM